MNQMLTLLWSNTLSYRKSHSDSLHKIIGVCAILFLKSKKAQSARTGPLYLPPLHSSRVTKERKGMSEIGTHKHRKTVQQMRICTAFRRTFADCFLPTNCSYRNG
jgi:hypothetical protein